MRELEAINQIPACAAYRWTGSVPLRLRERTPNEKASFMQQTPNQVHLVLLAMALSLASGPVFAGPGYALSFDGVDDYVDMEAGVIPGSGDFTVECWAYCPAAPKAYCHLLSQGSSGNAFYIGTDPNNNFRFGDSWANPGIPFPFAGWHHLAVVKTASETTFYLDGTNRLNKGSAILNPTGASGLRLGRQYGGLGEYWRGAIDEVRIWKVARTAAQIRLLKDKELTGKEANLVGYWPFREGSSSLMTWDVSGHKHGGRLCNRPRWVPSPVGWGPTVRLLGEEQVTHECGVAYPDPGAVVLVSPVGLAAADNYSLALKADGTVVGWGWWGAAQGAAAVSDVIGIAASYAHILALKADGTVVGWGDNSRGEADGARAGSNVVAIAAGSDFATGFSLALKADGTVVGWGNNSHGEADGARGGSNVVGIAAGATHSLALKSDGTVVGWGDNSQGEADGARAGSNIVAIAAGSHYSLALRADGTVVGWGSNWYGLADGTQAGSNVVAITSAQLHNLALKADGTVVGWGESGAGEADGTQAGSDVVAIAGGRYHSVALRVDGTVVGWGLNNIDQTEVPASVYDAHLPVSVSGDVDSATPGTYTLTYRATNSLGVAGMAQRTVVVKDTLPPSLVLKGDNPLLLEVNRPFLDPGATALDGRAGDLTGKIRVTGKVNTQAPGAYTLVYEVSDFVGNTSRTNREVWVCSLPSVEGFSGTVQATNRVNGTRQAALVARVNPTGMPTSVLFEYGLSTDYGGSTTVEVPAGFETVDAVAAVQSLAPGYNYYWRATATNQYGATVGWGLVLSVPPLYGRGDLTGDGVVDQSDLAIILTNLNGKGVVGESDLNTVLERYWPSSPWLVLTNAAGLGNSRVIFALSNSIAGAYSVEYSTNLVDWRYLGPATPRYEFADTNAPVSPKRYYRLRWP